MLESRLANTVKKVDYVKDRLQIVTLRFDTVHIIIMVEHLPTSAHKNLDANVVYDL